MAENKCRGVKAAADLEDLGGGFVNETEPCRRRGFLLSLGGSLRCRLLLLLAAARLGVVRVVGAVRV